ncbi:MAG: CoA transferase [Acidimicrobiaceae bacterium]|nr:CoA transferase [Acidimicrobiaceae bacterium]HAY68219.1 CoA transferase [Acidimicrobiaceae bacterium]
MSTQQATSGPLSGVRVVELGVWIAGPAAGGIMADWGADVIKIEPPEGDPSRLFHGILGGVLPSNPVFELDNRSKRSVVFDLRSEDGMANALRLIATADVFLTNIRTGALERLGLDYDTLSAQFPELIYAHISGFGREGPDADRAAFDIAAFWSRSGIADLLTAPGEDPPFQRGGMGDHNTGLAAAGAVSAALFERTKSGHGQLVSTSLFREGMYTIGFDLNTKLMWGTDIAKNGRAFASSPTANNYLLADGRRIWVIGVDVRRHWAPLCRAVGLAQLIEDERFATPRDRSANAEALIALLDAAFAAMDMAAIEAASSAEPDFFWAPVNSLDDLLADPQFAPSGALVEVPDSPGSSTTTTMVATPVDYSRTVVQPRSLAPELGQHTEEVLAELAAHNDA